MSRSKFITALMGLFIVGLSVTSASVSAQENSPEPTVYGRAIRYSPGYYSNTTAEFVVKFRWEDLPENTKVYLHYGFGGLAAADKPIKWQFPAEVLMNQQGKGLYSTVVSQIMHARTGSMRLDSLDFVFRVEFGSGVSIYIKGTDSPQGFYRTAIDLGDVGFEWTALTPLPLQAIWSE